jgi:glycosyltransferase involved in cell wall biosynthesis
MAITQGLLSEGYRVSAYSADAKTQAAFISLGIAVFRGRAGQFAATAELAGLCRREVVDVMHTHGYVAGVTGRLAAGVAGVPAVHTIHGFPAADASPARHALRVGIARACAPLTARLVLVNDDDYREAVDSHWAAAARCRLIRHGIPVPPTPAPVAPHDGRPALVAVGRLVEQKGYRYLLEAMPRVLHRYPGARLILVGDGPEREALRRRARELALDEAAIFVGFQPNPLEWLARAHLAVSSSLWEGLPLAVLEMMAARRPIVATACRGTRDLLRDDDTAMLAPCADSIALAERILDMLDSPARAAAMADRARRDMETQYHECRMVDAYVRLFREIEPVYGHAPLPRPLPTIMHPERVEMYARVDEDVA